MTYDEHAYTVVYTVTDDGGTLTAARGTATGEGAFANTYSVPAAQPTPGTGGSGTAGGEGSGTPATGDESAPALWAALAAGCMLALAAVLTIYRRRGRS